MPHLRVMARARLPKLRRLLPRLRAMARAIRGCHRRVLGPARTAPAQGSGAARTSKISSATARVVAAAEADVARPYRACRSARWQIVAAGRRLIVVVVLWLATSMVHLISPQEKGIVTTFGAYSRTLDSGTALTLPWPIQSVTLDDVTSVRSESIPEGDGEKLMLTGDQNLVDLTYLVRWNIKDLKQYMFQLAEPQQTVREVAEAAMRQSIAEVTLNDAMGSGRQQIEQNVRDRMQAVLDAYRSGVIIQGVDIKKTDPPTKVVDAFKEVLAAQQDAQSEVNRAQAWAQQTHRPRWWRGYRVRQGLRTVPACA